MPRNAYTEGQKREIVKRAKTIGAAAAAKESGVSYATVLRWMKSKPRPQNTQETSHKTQKKKLPTNTQMGFDLEIAVKEKEIEQLTAELNNKKAELKALKKEKETRDAAELKALVRKIVESGKPVDEVIELLRS